MEHCVYCSKKLEADPFVCPQCGRAVRAYRSIREYHYQPVPVQLAEKLAQQKGNPRTRARCRLLADAVRTGRVQTAEIRVDEQ